MGYKHIILGESLVSLDALIGSFLSVGSQMGYNISISCGGFVALGALTCIFPRSVSLDVF